jgi:hypothetical protein
MAGYLFPAASAAIRLVSFIPGKFFVEKGTLTIREDNEIFSVNAGESLLLWPQRLHVGSGNFRQI